MKAPGKMTLTEIRERYESSMSQNAFTDAICEAYDLGRLNAGGSGESHSLVGDLRHIGTRVLDAMEKERIPDAAIDAIEAAMADLDRVIRKLRASAACGATTGCSEAQPLQPRCPRCKDLNIDMKFYDDGFVKAQCRNCPHVASTHGNLHEFFPAPTAMPAPCNVSELGAGMQCLNEGEQKVKECRNCDYPKISAHHGRYTWQHTFEPVLESAPLTPRKEPVKSGSMVYVNNEQFTGYGIAMSGPSQRKSCISVLLENGNMWEYEAATVRNALPDEFHEAPRALRERLATGEKGAEK